MSARSSPATLEVDSRKIAVSNLDKVFYPKTGFTKGDVINYYIRIAPVMLPHLNKRPVSLKRYPDGVDGFFFYEKQCPSHAPKWIKTSRAAKKQGGHVDYCTISDLPSLVWAANIANLEFHTFQHMRGALQRPKALVFDLDPGAPAGITHCARVALHLKSLFDKLKLKSFPKTSGSKGMQLVVPLNTAVTYGETKAFAREVAAAMARECPELVVDRMSKQLRKGKVFIDWSQNDHKKTTVTVYSLRSKETPTVSTPLTWKEVQTAGRGRARRKSRVLTFEADEVLKRVEELGDLHKPVLTLKQKLPKVAVLRQAV